MVVTDCVGHYQAALVELRQLDLWKQKGLVCRPELDGWRTANVPRQIFAN